MKIKDSRDCVCSLIELRGSNFGTNQHSTWQTLIASDDNTNMLNSSKDQITATDGTVQITGYYWVL